MIRIAASAAAAKASETKFSRPHPRFQISGDFKTKGLSMFKSQQYRVKTAEYGELVKSSADADESRKHQDLEDCFVGLANNERGLADAYHNAVHIDELDRTRGERWPPPTNDLADAPNIRRRQTTTPER